MFQCNRCHKEYEGEPALKNGAGSFCSDCWEEMRARMVASTRRAAEERRGTCPWCKQRIIPALRNREGVDGEDVHNTCQECEKGRAWLLRCIRESDWPSKYVARTEAREKQVREKRALARAADRSSEPLSAPAPQAPTAETEARIMRMESMLNKLMEQLGG